MQSKAFGKLRTKPRCRQACTAQSLVPITPGAFGQVLTVEYLKNTAGVRELLVTEAWEEKNKEKNLLDMQKAANLSLQAQNPLILQCWSWNMRTHKESFSSYALQKAKPLFLTDICQYPSSAFTLLLLHHTCSSPSGGSHPRTLLLSPRRMSSLLGCHVRRWPFVQLWFWMNIFLNSTSCNVSQADLLPRFLELSRTQQQKDLSFTNSTKTLQNE